MRAMILLGGALLGSMTLSACSTTDDYASACMREYREGRERAIATGALVGGAAGAAIDDDNDARGAAIGAALGGLIGDRMSYNADPCGYGDESRYGYYDRNGRWVYR